MNPYEVLLIEAENHDYIVKEAPLYGGYKGRIKGNRIAIEQNLTSTEKACVLAEELGHYYTSVGNILDQSKTGNRKQEYRARLWGYNMRIGLLGIIRAYENGCVNRYEMAEYLEVTEEYLEDCISCYRAKYGVCTTVDNYMIYFIPSLAVCELK